MSGLQLGNVWIGVQPALGVEGDPMRLLFERDLTPHPQYAVREEPSLGRPSLDETGCGRVYMVFTSNPDSVPAACGLHFCKRYELR